MATVVFHMAKLIVMRLMIAFNKSMDNISTDKIRTYNKNPLFISVSQCKTVVMKNSSQLDVK